MRKKLTLALMTVALFSHAAAAQKPNIVLVMVDDMGYSDLGCYGGEIETPVLNSLAAGGIRFTQFYNTAKCAQSRATLLSGRYYPEVRLTNLDDCITIAEGMRTAGYATFMTGKWHLKGNPLDVGWDRYFGHLSGATNFFTGDETFRLDREKFDVPEEGFYTTDANVDYAIRFLDESRKPGQPFFLYIAFNAPHYPLHALEEDVKKYEGRYDIGWDKLREQRYRRMIDMEIIDPKWALSPRPDDVPAWDSLDEEERKVQALTMAAFAAMVDRVDQNMGRLVEKLKATGDFENTLILFLSDNGGCPFQRTKKETRENMLPPWDPASYWTYDKGWAHACNTPFRMYKRNQHEGGISTPLIAHWPAGIARPGRLDDAPGHLVDILPTCFELAGVTYPDTFNGKAVGPARGLSLAPLLAGKEREPHKELFFLFGDKQHTALRMGDWKIVSHSKQPWELYNVAEDRTELNNLAEDQPERLKRMQRRWERLYEETSREKE